MNTYVRQLIKNNGSLATTVVFIRDKDTLHPIYDGGPTPSKDELQGIYKLALRWYDLHTDAEIKAMNEEWSDLVNAHNRA